MSYRGGGSNNNDFELDLMIIWQFWNLPGNPYFWLQEILQSNIGWPWGQGHFKVKWSIRKLECNLTLQLLCDAWKILSIRLQFAALFSEIKFTFRKQDYRIFPTSQIWSPFVFSSICFSSPLFHGSRSDSSVCTVS